eukprot:m.18721 g.18721  ORF g.18721 m.18721 type:complete len:456 (+) comp3622_c0_seq1:304-1671(+)
MIAQYEGDPPHNAAAPSSHEPTLSNSHSTIPQTLRLQTVTKDVGRTDDVNTSSSEPTTPSTTGMSNRHRYLFAMPGMCLGSFGVGNLWRLAVHTWQLPPWIEHVTDTVCGILGAMAVVLWVAGSWNEAKHGRAPWSHANRMCLPFWVGLAVGGMGITSSSNFAPRFSTSLSASVWCIGVMLQLLTLAGAGMAGAMGVWTRFKSNRRLLRLDDFDPTIYPVTVGCGMIAPMAEVAMPHEPRIARGMADVLAFVALGFTVVLVVPVMIRLCLLLRDGGQSTLASVPNSVVQMAPFGLTMSGYVAARLPGSDNPNGGIGIFLLVGSLVSTILIAFFLPYLYRMPYSPKWATLTFPTISSGNAVLWFRNIPGHSNRTHFALDTVGAAYVALATLVVIMVWIRLCLWLRILAQGGDIDLNGASVRPRESERPPSTRPPRSRSPIMSPLAENQTFEYINHV